MEDVDATLGVVPVHPVSIDDDERLAAFRVIIRSPFDETTITVKKSDLTSEYVDSQFQCHVQFLQEKGRGTIIWPARWAHECRAAPVEYLAALHIPDEVAHDAMEEDEYRGESLVCIFEVAEDVTQEALLVWFQAGMNDEFPDLVFTNDRIEELRGKLAFVDGQIALLPNLKSELAENVDEELEFRKQRAQTLSRVREELQAELEQFLEQRRKQEEAALSKHEKYRLVLGKREPPLNYSVWEVHFQNTAEGQELAYLAAHKLNWSEYRLQASLDGRRAVAGKAPDPESGMKEIMMRHVKVSRVKHGQGMYRLLGGAGFYTGQWKHGHPHGHGTLINESGKYQVDMDYGRIASGPGTVVHARGDTYNGAMSLQFTRAAPSALKGMEYADATAEGVGRMDFSDGSHYEGAWVDGVPTGAGQYSDVAGPVLDGTFDDFGLMSGQCAATMAEIAKIGWWRRGTIERHGTEIDTRLGTYTGDFRFSMRHGFGRMDTKVPVGTYIGNFNNDFWDGRGLFEFGPDAPDADADAVASGEHASRPVTNASRPMSKARKAGLNPTNFSEQQVVNLPPFTMFRAESRWRCGRIRGGGVFTNTTGAANPLDFRLSYTMDYTNKKHPHLDSLAALDMSTKTDRDNRQRAVAASILAQRAKREAENVKRFGFYYDLAHDRMRQVVEKNREDRAPLHAIAATVAEKRAMFVKKEPAPAAPPVEETPKKKRGEDDASDSDEDSFKKNMTSPLASAISKIKSKQLK